MAKGKARTFAQDIMRGEHVVGDNKEHRAIPGGGTGPNSAWKFKGADGYKTTNDRKALPSGLTFGEMKDFDGAGQAITGTSIFDPVLCEIMYRWFCPPGGLVLDPFAGGSVRGIVAAKCGREYVGIDLRPEQAEANREQANRICGEGICPTWAVGDAAIVLHQLDISADFVFSCPPYGDLEVYSDDPADLSNMPRDQFIAAYRQIIAASLAKLKDNRFAVFVVGDYRDKAGYYTNFVGETVAAFRDAGARLYNEAILLTAIGSLPVRAGKQFAATRKLGKTHQNVLVFCKGDAHAATKACGEVEIDEELFAPDSIGEIEEDAPAATGEIYLDRVAPAEQPPLVSDSETPIERRGDIWIKREDLFERAGVSGGKVRTCWALAQGAAGGLVTAGSRASPQVNIVAHISAALGLPCHVHVPSGKLGPEVEAARRAGAQVIQHKPGYNTVIVARARSDAASMGWREIPFGMECQEAVRQVSAQVKNIPEGVKRVVVPVGSGMSLAGVLHGLASQGLTIPVLAVAVGADATKRLDEYAPRDWRRRVTLVKSGSDYHTPASVCNYAGLELDPIYEAKCLPFLKPDDLFWVVGIRAKK